MVHLYFLFPVPVSVPRLIPLHRRYYFVHRSTYLVGHRRSILMRPPVRIIVFVVSSEKYLALYKISHFCAAIGSCTTWTDCCINNIYSESLSTYMYHKFQDKMSIIIYNVLDYFSLFC